MLVTTVDLTALANDGIQLVAAIIGLVVTPFVIKWINAQGMIKDQAAKAILADRVNSLILHGIDYAKTKTESWVDPKVGTVKMDNDLIAEAINYAAAQGPNMLKKVGYDVDTDEGRLAIARMVVARLNITPQPALAAPAAPAAQPAAPH